VSIEPNNLQAWTSRGFVYEQMKDTEKAAASYARAMNIREDYEPAKAGFKRIGGQFGKQYQAFN
jgi:Tfp pilus assembly protein PilF